MVVRISPEIPVRGENFSHFRNSARFVLRFGRGHMDPKTSEELRVDKNPPLLFIKVCFGVCGTVVVLLAMIVSGHNVSMMIIN